MLDTSSKHINLLQNIANSLPDKVKEKIVPVTDSLMRECMEAEFQAKTDALAKYDQLFEPNLSSNPKHTSSPLSR